MNLSGMFAIGSRPSRRDLFDGDHVQRINLRHDALSAINDGQSDAGRHHHEIGLRYWHARAIAQPQNKWSCLTLPPLSYPLRIHCATKLPDGQADFNLEAQPPNCPNQPILTP